MSRIRKLQEKYSGFAVISAPLSDCPICQGIGEFRNALGDIHICPCVCTRGPDHLRKILMEVFHQTLSDLVKKAMKEKKDDSIS